MHPDKKVEELEEIKEFEREKKFEQENELETETEIETKATENIEENEGEIKTDEVLEKKRRREAIFELVLFFVLGVLLGVTIKTEAVKKITIGFNDYQVTAPAQSYDVAAMKKDLDDRMAAEQAAQELDQQNQGQPQQVPAQ